MAEEYVKINPEELAKAKRRADRIKLTDQQKEFKKSISKRLTFGSLCKAFKSTVNGTTIWIPKKGDLVRGSGQNQVDCITLMYSLVYSNKEGCPYKLTPATASNVFNNIENINRECLDKIKCGDAYDIIRKNVEDCIYNMLDDERRQIFFLKLQHLIAAIPEPYDHHNLKMYVGSIYDSNNAADFCDMVAKCIYWSMQAPNKWDETATRLVLTKKPRDLYNYDPHHFIDTYSASTAIQFIIYEDACDSKSILFNSYNHEDCVDFILQYSLVIKDINCSMGRIEIICIPLSNNHYHLRRVKPEDFLQVRHLIYCHLEEFHEKRSWVTEKNKNLAEMVFVGLSKERKWTAYAYFDSNNAIVAYLDYKIRSDGEYELGTQLTVPFCRGQKLATGLINFFRLRFINSRFFSGTYEENEHMKAVFRNAGFTPHMFVDSKTGEISNRIQERINRSFPDDDSKMTNSVYFYVDSLISNTLHGALKVDETTGEVLNPIME